MLDETQFKKCLEELRGTILAQCYRMMGSQESAKDATQDTLTQAWSQRESYTPIPGIPFDNWVKRIATNVCLDRLRRRENKQPVYSEIDPDKNPDLRSEREMFEKAKLDEIMTFLQTCMEERDFWMFKQKLAGLSYNEIVEVLPKEWQLSFEGVKSRFDRKIKTCVEEARKKFDSNE